MMKDQFKTAGYWLIAIVCIYGLMWLAALAGSLE